MQGISSKALGFGDPGNKFRYNGNEEQRKEFSDGSGWETYDFNARTYDAQTGRFIQIDPLSEDGGQESLTIYQFGFNDPIKYNDPDGNCPSCIWGAVLGAAVEYVSQVTENLSSGESFAQSLKPNSFAKIGVATFAGAASGGLSVLKTTSKVAKVAVEVGKMPVGASESAANQYIQTGTVSMTDVASDLALNFVAGEFTNVKFYSDDVIKHTEKKVDQSIRKAANDPTSSGRAKTIQDNKDKLKHQEGVNIGVSQAVSGVGAKLLSIPMDSKPYSEIFNDNNYMKPAVDNTNVKKPELRKHR